MRGKAAASIAAFLCVWEALVKLGVLPRVLVPAPSDVVAFMANPKHAWILAYNLAWTAARASGGFAIGLCVGFSLGFLLSIKSLNEYLMPVATALFAVPSIAWIPILIVWVGLKPIELPMLASFLCSFPPVLYGVVNTIRTMDPEQVGVAMVLGARPSMIMRKIVLPQTILRVLPLIKTQAVVAWKSTFAAEMIALSTGLGALAMTYATTIDTDGLIAVIAVLSAVTMAIVQGFDALEKLLSSKWFGSRREVSGVNVLYLKPT